MVNKKYSIRKTLTGVGSVAIATLFLGVSQVHADDVNGESSEPTTTVTTSDNTSSSSSDSNVNKETAKPNETTSDNTSSSASDSNVNKETDKTTETTSSPSTSDSSANNDTAKPTETTSDNTSSSASDSNVNPDTVKPTETTGVLRVQDIDIINQKAINDKATVIDLKDSESTTVSVPTDKDSYLAKGYAYDYTINVTTGEQFNKDKDVTVSRNQTTTLARIYRYVGVNTGDKDTLVKTDNSLKKDVYFVGALDKDGKTALERFAVRGGGKGDPYLETGSMYEINGVQVWCSDPTMPATAGQKYVAKVVDESLKNALINAFGIGYGDNSKDNYLLVDIEQGMMWEAQGYTHIFDKVQINPNNSGSLRNLTSEEKEMVDKFKEAISKASEIYQSEKKANLTYNGVSVSDTDDAVTELTFEEGKVPDSIELTGDAQMLHYYKNGAIKTPDGTVLTIDDVKGLATLSKLSGLTQGDYVLKMSMIRDNVQGDTTEWTAQGQQTMKDYRIKDAKWETVKIKVTPKNITSIPNEAPKVDKPSIDVPVSDKPDKPIPDKPVTPTPDKPVTTTPDKPIPDKPITPTPDKPTPDKPVTPTPDKPIPDKPVTPTPDKPVTPKPNKPITPTPDKPVTPVSDKSVTPTPVSHKEEPSTPSMSRVAKYHELPNTGQKEGVSLGLLGLTLATFGFASLKRKRIK